MTMKFTIVVTDEIMTLEHGQEPKARPMWVVDGITFYVLGPLNGLKYEQAANLAMNHCEGKHISASRLRRYSTVTPRKTLDKSPDTKRMKGF